MRDVILHPVTRSPCHFLSQDSIRGDMTSYTEQALVILHEWVQSEVLRKHCYAVAASMRHFAQLNNADADLWGAVGLLHDLDFEQYPQMPPPGDLPAGLRRPSSPARRVRRCSRCTHSLELR